MVQYSHVDLGSSQGTYVSVIIHGRATEMVWFGTYVPGSTPMATIKFFYKSGNNVLDFE